MPASLPPSHKHLAMTWHEIGQWNLVFDGSHGDTPPLIDPTLTQYSSKNHHNNYSQPWKSIRIHDGGLFIVDTCNPIRGLCYPVKCGQATPFIRIPRKSALEITLMTLPLEHAQLCLSLREAYKAQRASLFRGKKKTIYSDFKSVSMGAQPCRAEPGIRSKSYHAERMTHHDWNNIVMYMKRVEHAYASFIPTEELRQINSARQIVGFKTMTTMGSPQALDLPSNQPCCRTFGALSFGINVHLSCHTDDDFAYSVVTVHMGQHNYSVTEDNIIVYFCFPRLGMAVALRPGDILIFNPLEPHAVSSRVKKGDEVLVLSMYLKTAIVGLNDNTIELTAVQDVMSKF